MVCCISVCIDLIVCKKKDIIKSGYFNHAACLVSFIGFIKPDEMWFSSLLFILFHPLWAHIFSPYISRRTMFIINCIVCFVVRQKNKKVNYDAKLYIIFTRTSFNRFTPADIRHTGRGIQNRNRGWIYILNDPDIFYLCKT